MLVVAGVVGLVASAPAGAASAPVTDGSWYWMEQPQSISTPAGPVASPTGPVAPPDVPKGDFAVAVVAGQADKETFLHIPTDLIPMGSTVLGFKLVLKEDMAGRNLNAASAEIQAIPVSGFFVGGTQAGIWSQRPATLSSPVGKGTRASDGTWTFDLTGIVSAWIDGAVANNGVALVPSAASSAPTGFEVVWSGANPQPLTSGSFVPPPAPPTTTAASPAPATAPPVTAAAPVTITPELSTPVATPTALPSPTPTPAVVSTPAAASGSPPSPRPLRRRAVDSATPLVVFVVLAILVLGGLGAVAAGELGEPGARRQGSVLRALESRAHPAPVHQA